MPKTGVLHPSKCHARHLRPANSACSRSRLVARGCARACLPAVGGVPACTRLLAFVLGCARALRIEGSLCLVVILVIINQKTSRVQSRAGSLHNARAGRLTEPRIYITLPKIGEYVTHGRYVEASEEAESHVRVCLSGRPPTRERERNLVWCDGGYVKRAAGCCLSAFLCEVRSRGPNDAHSHVILSTHPPVHGAIPWR